MDDPASEQYAYFPLTVFDRPMERNTFVTGWLLEGAVDSAALAAALDQVTQKWRMLAGRLESVKEGDDTKWRLKIPLGPIPDNYPTYALTTSTSSVPLSSYVSLPLPAVSTSLPLAVFLHASTPRQYATWESTKHPLTCWNVVHFPAAQNWGIDYTCIGFARSHGIFDGSGAAQIVHALVAEMHGEAWTVPPLPHAGLNQNPIEDVLASVSAEPYSCQDYAGYTRVGISTYARFVAWHVREHWWRGADRRVVVMPKAVMTRLVEEVRSAIRDTDAEVGHISTGDVLVAWVFKTIYSSATHLTTPIHCTNLANFRPLLADKLDSVSLYPHNTFIPLPYPILSVSDVQSYTLPTLTKLFSVSRKSLSLHHVIDVFRLLQQPTLLMHPHVSETLIVSNVSASRILEADWSAIGGKRTVCGYRYSATPLRLMFSNAVYIAGRLEDGSVVLDVTLNKVKFNLLVKELEGLKVRFEEMGVNGVEN